MISKPQNDGVVIIPTYNEIENIRAIIRAVTSLEKPLDVLIIDDGSPDGTADAVTEERFINNLKNTHGITVVFITHREKVLDSADKIIEL